jgi:threonyl-tRNA synthetase
MIRQAMIDAEISFYEADDEAAFYGPKIDVQVWSAIGREFSFATNQVDFDVPRRFNLSFTDEDGREQTPLCIHRAPLGSHERTIGFLIEQYNGAFPVWLSPEQVRVIPITDSHNEYAAKVLSRLREGGIRAQADLSSGRVGRKIRRAQLFKLPYMLIVGDRELADGTLSLRVRDGRQLNNIPLNHFVDQVSQQISSRSPDLWEMV